LRRQKKETSYFSRYFKLKNEESLKKEGCCSSIIKMIFSILQRVRMMAIPITILQA